MDIRVLTLKVAKEGKLRRPTSKIGKRASLFKLRQKHSPNMRENLRKTINFNYFTL